MSDPVMSPRLHEIGVIPASPFSEGEPQDETLLQEIVAAREPHVAAELADRAWHEALMQDRTAVVDRDSEDFQKYKEYLAAEKLHDDDVDGREPDEMTLPEYELMQLHKYHGMDNHPNYPVTNGFVAEFALASARGHKYAAKQAGALVAFKHYTKRNIEILEGELPEADRELFAPLKRSEFNVIEEQPLATDPEAKALSDRYKVLEAMFQKRWAIDTLAKMLGTDLEEIGEALGRENVEAVATFIEQYGDNLTA